MRKTKQVILSAVSVILACTAVFFSFNSCAPDLSETAVQTEYLYSGLTECQTYLDTTDLGTSDAETSAPATAVPEGSTVPADKQEAVTEKPDKSLSWQGSFDPYGSGHLLDAPFIDQRQKYPTGCESVSAVMACNYFGVGVTPEMFIDDYLDKGVSPFLDADEVLFGDDPNIVFLGDPYSDSGWGCYAPVIEKACNKFLGAYGMYAKDIYGRTLSALCEDYIDNDTPVLIWATQNMEDARQSKTWFVEYTSYKFTWTAPMHCLLLVGYDDDYYYFNDPLKGKDYRYPRDITEAQYDALGSQAVVLLSGTAPAEDDRDGQNGQDEQAVSAANETTTLNYYYSLFHGILDITTTARSAATTVAAATNAGAAATTTAPGAEAAGDGDAAPPAG